MGSVIVLTVNQAAVGLILFGLVMLAIEALLPTYGVLGVGGLVVLLLGVVVLVDVQGPSIAVSGTLVLAIAAVGVVLLITVLAMAISAARRRPVGGDTELVGKVTLVSALQSDNPCAGWIQLQGEQWQVRCTNPLKEGEEVKVLARRGVQLEVAAAKPASGE
ncbi:NfeD family protein [Pseudomonas sp. M47T1]|uniref:NfeD family protein n=1 Tax=Pseudomonas sp. M47T1 TaxID=1179778 RepID=UPI0012FBBEB5|nr:NfeD family protein [Pseudomonas sp. M47T1]